MIDFETLALTPDAVIVQVGAVAFDVVAGVVDTQNRFVSKPDLKQPGRVMDDSTICWWMSQPDHVRAIFSDVELSRPLERVITDLYQWAEETGARYIWSHGLGYDVPILKHALAQFDLYPWWRFPDERDTRTLFALIQDLAGLPVMINRGVGVHHHAGDDAVAQAEAVCLAYSALHAHMIPTTKGTAQ